MLYLDANAFYWYFGREKLFEQPSEPKHDVEKMNRFLDIRKDKSIPASVLMEMIVHFRDNPDIIIAITNFCVEKKFKVYNNLHDYNFTSEELALCQVVKNKVLLKQYAYSLLKKKIDIEVKHANIFLQIISLIYAKYYLKSCESLNNEIQDNIIRYLGKLSIAWCDEMCCKLTSSLQTGYADNNRSEQALKKQYIELLIQNCVIFQMIIDTTVKYLDGDENLYDVMCKSAGDARNRGFTDDKIMQIIKNTFSTDLLFLHELETEIPSMFLKKGYSRHQADYLKLMLKAWLERGQKLIKNDIFDMLCVGVLDKPEIDFTQSVLVDQNSYLISFDETMMKFLCNDKENSLLIRQFLLA